VVTVDGEEPVPGASVRGLWTLGELHGEARTVQAGPEGVFFVPLPELARLTREEQDAVRARLVLTAPGLSADHEDLGTPDEPGPRWWVEAWFRREPPLLVRVLATGDVPVEMGYVEFSTEDDHGGAWTDELGVAELDLPDAPGVVHAHHESHGVATARVDGAPEAPLELVLSPTARLAGRVVDRRRRPIAGAEVGAENDEDSVWTQTDGEGRFALRGVAPGTYDLWVVDTLVQPGVPSHQAGLELVADLRAHRVRVVDSVGRPAHGADLDVSALAGEPAREAELDAYASWARVGPGEFGLVLAPGTEFLLRATRGEHEGALRLPADAPQDVELRLAPPRPPAHLTFDVHDADGRPLERGWYARLYEPRTGALVASLGPRDDEAPSGPLHVRVIGDGQHGAAVELQLDLAPGERRHEVVRLRPGVRVRVLLHGVRPGHAKVSLWPVGGRRGQPAYSRTRTACGEFVSDRLSIGGEHALIEALPPGRYRVLTHGRGRAEVEREVTLAGVEARLELEVRDAE